MRRSRTIDRLLVPCLAAAFGMTAVRPVRGDVESPLTGVAVVERVNQAIDRALEYLAGKQSPDGSWDVPSTSTHESAVGTVGTNRVYSTSMACLVLEIYNHYLPAYQR